MQKTNVVGICNYTPDSFSDGGLLTTPHELLAKAYEMLEDRATFVDVGAESTRPGATPLSAGEEWARLEQIAEPLTQVGLMEHVSLDTMHPESARRFMELGCAMLNDITGFRDTAMVDVALGFPETLLIVGHMPTETPGQAHGSPEKCDDQDEVVDWLEARIRKMVAAGVARERIVVDPCLGYYLTARVSRYLLRHCAEMTEYPVLLGYSNKSHLHRTHQKEIGVNLAACAAAHASGAAYIRVHDVKQHVLFLEGIETYGA